MFGSQIFDVIIGMFFIYALLALLCTVINEWIASILRIRARTLVAGVKKIIQGKDQDQEDLLNQIFEHPLINSLCKKTKKLSLLIIFSGSTRIPSKFYDICCGH